VLRQRLTHAEAVITELRGVVAELRKQIDAQQAHIHRLVKITFGRGGDPQSGATPGRVMATAGHFFWRGDGATSFGVGYFARSARQFVVSSGLFVAV